MGSCSICGGSEAEHGPHIQHAFTRVPGDLRPPAAPTKKRQDTASDAMGRLVAILVRKGHLTIDEALEVAGMKEVTPSGNGS